MEELEIDKDTLMEEFGDKKAVRMIKIVHHEQIYTHKNSKF